MPACVADTQRAGNAWQCLACLRAVPSLSYTHTLRLQDADIVIVEYSLNDEATFSSTPFDNAVRRPFERLLRKLLQLPKRPAVILLNA